MLESSCPYPPKSANTTVFAKKKKKIPRTSLQKQNAKRDICHKNICKQTKFSNKKKTANNFSWHWMSSLHPVPYAFPSDPG